MRYWVGAPTGGQLPCDRFFGYATNSKFYLWHGILWCMRYGTLLLCMESGRWLLSDAHILFHLLVCINWQYFLGGQSCSVGSNIGHCSWAKKNMYETRELRHNKITSGEEWLSKLTGCRILMVVLGLQKSLLVAAARSDKLGSRPLLWTAHY